MVHFTFRVENLPNRSTSWGQPHSLQWYQPPGNACRPPEKDTKQYVYLMPPAIFHRFQNYKLETRKWWLQNPFLKENLTSIPKRILVLFSKREASCFQVTVEIVAGRHQVVAKFRRSLMHWFRSYSDNISVPMNPSMAFRKDLVSSRDRQLMISIDSFSVADSKLRTAAEGILQAVFIAPLVPMLMARTRQWRVLIGSVPHSARCGVCDGWIYD